MLAGHFTSKMSYNESNSNAHFRVEVYNVLYHDYIRCIIACYTSTANTTG